MGVSKSSQICTIQEDITDEQDLLITFKHTFVKKDFDSLDASINEEDLYFIKSINSNGT